MIGARADVRVSLGNVTLGSTTTDAKGRFQAQYRVPARTPVGATKLRASGGGVVATTPVEVHTDWPNTGANPRRTYASTVEKALTGTSVANLKRVSFFDVGRGVREVSVVGGVVYASLAPDDVHFSEVAAFDGATGRPLWAYSGESSDFTGAPLIVGYEVCAQSDGPTHVLDRVTGKLRVTITDAVPDRSPFDTTTQMLVDGVVVQSSDGDVAAFHPITHKRLWSVSRHGQAVVVGGVVTAYGEDVLGLDLRTGVRRWTAPYYLAFPVGVGGSVVACSMFGDQPALVALRAATGRVAWTSPAEVGRCGGGTAVVNGVLVVDVQSPDGSDQSLSGFDPATGRLKWKALRNVVRPLGVNGAVIAERAGGFERIDVGTGAITASVDGEAPSRNSAVADGKFWVPTASGIVVQGVVGAA